MPDPLSTVADPERLGFSGSRLKRLAEHLRGYTERGYLVGLSAQIARRGELAFAQTFGHQAKGGAPLTPESLFRIYSMTKPVTTVAALILFEEGLLKLTDPVTTYLPAFKKTKVCVGSEHQGVKLEPQAREITVQHLMTHTAGLSYGWYQDTPVDALYRATGVDPATVPLGDFVDLLAAQPLAFQPGSHWRYSHATDVLGHLVEVVADESLDSFLTRRIFEPLGMVDTGFGVPSAKVGRFTSVYCPTEAFGFGADYSQLAPGGPIYPVDTPETSRFVEPEIPLVGYSGGGGLVSTLPDYMRFAQMLLNGGTFGGARILGRKTTHLMTVNHVPGHIRPLEIGGVEMLGTGFGLGVSVLEDVAASGSLGSRGQYGWSGAAMTDFWVDPAEDLIGVFMTQFMPSDFYEVSREFRVLTYAALTD